MVMADRVRRDSAPLCFISRMGGGGGGGGLNLSHSNRVAKQAQCPKGEVSLPSLRLSPAPAVCLPPAQKMVLCASRTLPRRRCPPAGDLRLGGSGGSERRRCGIFFERSGLKEFWWSGHAKNNSELQTSCMTVFIPPSASGMAIFHPFGGGDDVEPTAETRPGQGRGALGQLSLIPGPERSARESLVVGPILLGDGQSGPRPNSVGPTTQSHKDFI